MERQRVKVTCPRPHSWLMAELDLEPIAPDSWSHCLSTPPCRLLRLLRYHQSSWSIYFSVSSPLGNRQWSLFSLSLTALICLSLPPNEWGVSGSTVHAKRRMAFDFPLKHLLVPDEVYCIMQWTVLSYLWTIFQKIKSWLPYKYEMNMCQIFYLTHELMREPVRYYNLFKGEFKEHTSATRKDQKWQIDAKLVNIHRAIINSSPLNTIFISTNNNHLHYYQFSFYRVVK